jgi:hypothetical protein
MKNQDDKLGKLYSDESVLNDKLRSVIKEEHNLTVKMDALVFALEAVSDVHIELTCNLDIVLKTLMGNIRTSLISFQDWHKKVKNAMFRKYLLMSANLLHTEKPPIFMARCWPLTWPKHLTPLIIPILERFSGSLDSETTL